jgi:hypothetical protein
VSLLVGMLTGGAVLFYYAWWKQDRIPASLVELDTQASVPVLACFVLQCKALHGLSCHDHQRCCRVPAAAATATASHYLHCHCRRRCPPPPCCPQMFFEVLLPPVIFNAGFSIKKKNFFRHFTTLTLFGVVGTFMTAGLIAAGEWLVVASSSSCCCCAAGTMSCQLHRLTPLPSLPAAQSTTPQAATA